MKNEYLKDTKKKIAQYEKMKDLIALRKKDIEVEQANLEVCIHETAREQSLRNIKVYDLEIMKMERDIEALEKGFSRLGEVAYNIITLKYIKKETWVAVALSLGYCQSRCKELGREALMIVAEYLHGISVHQDLNLLVGMGCY